MGTQLKGDFIGFSFDGNHSSDLGIVRTSNGSRYDDNLLPTSQDKTAAVPGGDGTYYWDTSHTQKQFNIPIAFDGLTEKQYRRLRQIFNTKGKIAPLIFDEAPYKYYMAKPTGIPQLKTICFDEDGQRIYRGEGTIQFTAYYPYAKSVHKWLDEYDNENKNEWAAASGMLSNNKDAEGNVKYDNIEGNTITVYNPGDMETDFCLYFKLTGTEYKVDFDGKTVQCLYPKDSFELSRISLGSNSLYFNTFSFEPSDTQVFYICINTKTNLIEGLDYDLKPTGILYNKFITSGDFFKIPLNESKLNLEGATASKIEYDYIYY